MRSQDDTFQTGKNTEGSKSRRLAFTALLIALAMVFSYVESLIPLPVGIPGVKIGLANLVVVVSLYLFGVPYAFAVSLLRIVLTGFLFGSGSAIATVAPVLTGLHLITCTFSILQCHRNTSPELPGKIWQPDYTSSFHPQSPW